MLCAVSVIFGYIENLFPIPIAVPGIKLGLGNIVLILCLYNFNKKTTFLIMFLKVAITSLLFASPTTFIYSLAGGILSVCAMIVAKHFKFRMITVSICGGVSHNLGQILAASLILKNINVVYYLPILIISGIIVSTITGIISIIINPRISKIISVNH